MSVLGAVYDFLGHKLSRDEVMTALASSAHSYAWMGLARRIGISYVSAALQAAEVRVYEPTDDGRGRRVRDHTHFLWAISPNPNQSHAEFIDQLVTQMLLHGEAVVLPLGRGAKQLYVADHGYHTQEGGLRADTISGATVNGYALNRSWTTRACMRFRLDSDAEKGRTQLEQALSAQYDRLANAAANAAVLSKANKFKYSMPARKMGTNDDANDQYERIVENLKSFVEADGNAVFPQYQGFDLEPMPAQHEGVMDDFEHVKKAMFETAAMCLRMPVSMLYGNTNNFNSVVDSFLTFSADPVARVLSEGATRTLFTEQEVLGGARVVFNTHTVKHVDLFEVANGADKLIRNGLYSINGLLGYLGDDPVDEPWAGKHFVTKNYEDADGGENNG